MRVPGRLSHCDRFADSAKPPIGPVIECQKVKTKVANIHRVKANSYKLQKTIPKNWKNTVQGKWYVKNPQWPKSMDLRFNLRPSVSFTWRDRRACTTPRWPPAAARWSASNWFVRYTEDPSQRDRLRSQSEPLAVFPPLSGTSTLHRCVVLKPINFQSAKRRIRYIYLKHPQAIQSYCHCRLFRLCICRLTWASRLRFGTQKHLRRAGFAWNESRADRIFTFGRCKFPTKTIWWIVPLRFHGSFPLKWKTVENRNGKSKTRG